MALFTTAEQFVPYSQTLSTLEFEKIAEFVESAEAQYIKRYIGSDAHQALTIAFNLSQGDSPTVLEQVDNDLLHQVRRPLAQFVLYLAADSLDVQVDDTGIRRTETESLKTAYQYQRAEWKRSKLLTGYMMLDELLSFLERNIGDYPEYAASPEYRTQKELFLPSVELFNEFYPINEDRPTFYAITPVAKRYEREYILPVLGETKFTEIKDELRTETLSEENIALLGIIRSAVANGVIADAMVKLTVQFDQSGIVVREFDNSKTVEARRGTELERVNLLRSEAKEAAQRYLQQLEIAMNPAEAEPINHRVENQSGAGGWMAV